MSYVVSPATAVAVALMLACTGALAQKKPTAEETPLSRCMAENRQAVVDLGQALEAARRKHVVSPVVVTRLQGLQASLARVRDSLPRGARSLADCEQVALAITAEKDKFQRVTGAEAEAAPGDLPVSAVIASPAGPAAVAPATPPAAQPAAPAVTSAPVAPAPSAVAAAPAVAAPPAMAPDVCREQQARQYNELAQGFAAVAQAAQLPADKVPLFQQLSERLSRLRGPIADRSAPGWDCNGILQTLGQIRTELQPLLPRK